MKSLNNLKYFITVIKTHTIKRQTCRQAKDKNVSNIFYGLPVLDHVCAVM